MNLIDFYYFYLLLTPINEPVIFLCMTNHRYIYYLIGSSIILAIINTVFYLAQSSQSEKNHQKTLKTALITDKTNSLLLTASNAESGQRGYLLTGNETYLNHYYTSEKRIEKTLEALLILTADNPYQQNNIKDLKRWLDIKRKELALTIRLKKSSRQQQALEKVRTNEGKFAMEKIEQLVFRIISAEKKAMQKHHQSFVKLNERIQIFTIAGSYVLLVIIIASLITIIHNREQILKLFRQVDDKNKLLESQKNELINISNELIKQNGELERFAYIASHDLRSPGINLNSLLRLYENAPNPREKEEFMQAIKSVSANLLIKLDDLIELMRKRNGPAVENEDLSFEEVFMKIMENLSADVKQTKSKVEHDFTQAPCIRYPKSYLESIMQNLLTNAIKYRHPDRQPHIKIRTYLESEKTCMQVKDNGLGIDLKKHGHKLFGIYNTFHNREDSKGIGLFITKAQIVTMGGDIIAESTAGEGTTFTVVFT